MPRAERLINRASGSLRGSSSAVLETGDKTNKGTLASQENEVEVNPKARKAERMDALVKKWQTSREGVSTILGALRVNRYLTGAF